MSENKMDFAKVLAVLAQTKSAPPPLEGVQRRVIDVPYIRNNGTVDTLYWVRLAVKSPSKQMKLEFRFE